MIKQPSPQKLNQLIEVSLALGMSKKANNSLVPIKFAYLPYSTTSDFYSKLQLVTVAWQKLAFCASRSRQFIQSVYEEIKISDPMVRNILRIMNLKQYQEKEELVFTRTDFFINKQHEPKIIQYNLYSVSMAAHSQNFQQAKKLTDESGEYKYINNTPNKIFTEQVIAVYRSQNLKGIFLILVSPKQVNIVQQRLLQINLLRSGIKVKRISLAVAGKTLHKNEQGQLILDGQIVSMAYYRTGYQCCDYDDQTQCCWKARQVIELSKAIKIPNIEFDLVNQKRMQVELSKKDVYSKFLNKQECKLLELSLVPVWEFDHLSEEQFKVLLSNLEQSEKQYVLKPNSEGGGHNIYGGQALQKLKEMSETERKKFILMQKIMTQPLQNILVDSTSVTKLKCIYQVSQYGLLQASNGQLRNCQTSGFLIRIKPQQCNQGGIMAGVGSICSWAIKQQK